MSNRLNKLNNFNNQKYKQNLQLQLTNYKSVFYHVVARFCREIEHVLSDSRIGRQKKSTPGCMTDAPETDASFLAPVSGAGFWSMCHGH